MCGKYEYLSSGILITQSLKSKYRICPCISGNFSLLVNLKTKASNKTAFVQKHQQHSRGASYHCQIGWQKDNPHRERMEFEGAAMVNPTKKTHPHTHTRIDDWFHMSPMLPSICSLQSVDGLHINAPPLPLFSYHLPLLFLMYSQVYWQTI